MIGLLTIGLIGLALCTKKRGVGGIGATYKRRIYRELANINRATDFNLSYEDQSEEAKRLLQEQLDFVNSQYPKRQPITPERYFKQLRRAYKAISGIGETFLPYFESKIRNEKGDVILIHRDYGTPDEQFTQALIHIEENYIGSDYQMGWWDTVVAIATGKKFVWTSNKEHRGIEKLIFGKSAPIERKRRISYLSTPQKGGMYPEMFAHSIWEGTDRTADDMEILDGVLDAIRATESTKQAKQWIMDRYIKDHTIEEEYNPKDDLPF